MSENFYFDMNSESVKKMLSGHVDYADISTYARLLVFFFKGIVQIFPPIIYLFKIIQVVCV